MTIALTVIAAIAAMALVALAIASVASAARLQGEVAASARQDLHAAQGEIFRLTGLVEAFSERLAELEDGARAQETLLNNARADIQQLFDHTRITRKRNQL